MLETLNYNVCFSIPLDFLLFNMYRLFKNDDSQVAKRIKDSSMQILLKMLYDRGIYAFSFKTIGLAVLLYSLQKYY